MRYPATNPVSSTDIAAAPMNSNIPSQRAAHTTLRTAVRINTTEKQESITNTIIISIIFIPPKFKWWRNVFTQKFWYKFHIMHYTKSKLKQVVLEWYKCPLPRVINMLSDQTYASILMIYLIYIQNFNSKYPCMTAWDNKWNCELLEAMGHNFANLFLLTWPVYFCVIFISQTWGQNAHVWPR